MRARRGRRRSPDTTPRPARPQKRDDDEPGLRARRGPNSRATSRSKPSSHDSQQQASRRFSYTRKRARLARDRARPCDPEPAIAARCGRTAGFSPNSAAQRTNGVLVGRARRESRGSAVGKYLIYHACHWRGGREGGCVCVCLLARVRAVWCGKERERACPGTPPSSRLPRGQLAKLARPRLCAPKRFAAACLALPTGSLAPASVGLLFASGFVSSSPSAGLQPSSTH